jgi:nucleoside-diphosphate-sugar epimerase
MLAARSNGPGDFIQTNIFRAPGSPALLAQLACREVHGFPLPCIFRPTRYSARSAKKDFSRKRLPIGQTHRILRAKHHPSHFVRTLHETYELPTLVANCSNNCGRYHFPEKLIPHVIMKGLAGEPPPVYGERNNIRDCLYVEEHANALTLVLRGAVSGTHNVSGRKERANPHVVESVCDLLGRAVAECGRGAQRRLISFGADRPDDDKRYGIAASKR